MHLLDDLPCLVMATDRDGKIIDVNSSLLALLGGDKAFWLVKPMHDLFSIPSRIFLQTHLWPMLLHDGILEEINLEVVDLHKTKTPVLVNCKRSNSAATESFLWVLFVSRERNQFELALLEARNRAESNLRIMQERELTLAEVSAELVATQEKVSMANESGGVGIWDLNLQTGELIWDDIMYRLYGLEPQSQTNAYELWSSHLHPEDKRSAEDAFKYSLSSGNDFFNEFRVLWPDGSVHYLRGFGRIRKDDTGTAVRIVGTNIDVTENHLQSQALKEARDKAEAANQSKGQFLANMSHEIRTPMNAILGMLKLAQKTDLDSQQRDYVSKSEGAAQSLLSLINDILDFSKIEAGKMTLESEPFHVEQLMRGLGVVLSANAGAKSIEVLFGVDPNLPPILVGDAMRLQQVLINLGGNAIKFTPKGQVTITLCVVSQANDSVTVKFTVKDTGIGIAPENQAHIFSDFSQAEGSTTRRFGGTGLGLSICRRIVDLMGGVIRIDSVLGQGSTFSFELKFPVAKSELPERSPAQSALISPQTLVIDDNPVAGKLTLQMLLSLGWSAQLVSSGAQALEMIIAKLETSPIGFPFAAIYVDWYMPDMDGWETINQIKEVAKKYKVVSPKIIMVTGGGRELLEQRTSEEQKLICGYLVKPVTAGMLYDAYSQAFENKSGVRAVARSRNGPRQLAGMRILVVEDNLINQQVADELLSLEGATVSLAANGQLGVDAVAAAAPQFDVVLMDIQMPVLDGYGATKAIRNELGLKELPIIAMTANAMSTDRAACIAGGMNEHVGKPFDITKLVSILIRFTGLTLSAKDTDAADQIGAHPHPNIEVAGLDLATALARMSGMRGLYARTARDFSRVLDTIVSELRNCIVEGEQKAALMRLHTLKGNAGTLGANDLAVTAADLEKVSKTENWVVLCADGLDELARVCRLTKNHLELAIKLIEGANETQEKPAIQYQSDYVTTLSMLQELAQLAGASDLQVLARFAEFHQNLIDLPNGFCDQLEEALQNLDIDKVCVLCNGMMDVLKKQNANKGVSIT